MTTPLITNILASITITLSTNVVSEQLVAINNPTNYFFEQNQKDVTYQVVQTKMLTQLHPNHLTNSAIGFCAIEHFTNITIMTNWTVRRKRVEQWEDVK